MDDDDRKQELEQYRQRHVHFYYAGATAKKNERHFDAMMHEGGLFRRKIFEHAAEPWEGNSIPLKADLIRLNQQWPQLAGPQDGLLPPCPLTFEDKDTKKVLQGSLKQEEVDNQMQILRGVIGVGTDGWVSNEDYTKAKADSTRMKSRAIDNADDDFERETIMKYWPFDDFNEKE